MKKVRDTIASMSKGLRIACGIIVILVVLSGYLGYRVYALTRGSTNEVQQIITEVGKIVSLPTDEVPTVATVSDPTKLKDQAFFADAQVGDKVLIYAHARRAILWRPSTHKIIGIAPITDAAAATP